jgi:hypothetical protein
MLEARVKIETNPDISFHNSNNILLNNNNNTKNNNHNNDKQTATTTITTLHTKISHITMTDGVILSRT